MQLHPIESVAARSHNRDRGMLQPVAAYPYMGVGMLGLEVKKEAGRKQLEVLGRSSAARSATGGHALWQGGAAQAT
jgi:hypothetical protein